MTGMSGGIGRRLIPLLLVLAFIGLPAARAAWAEPPAITKAKSEAEALKERIDELSDQLDALVEDYNYATARLSQTTAAAKETRATLAQVEKDLEEVRTRLSARVVEIYKAGHVGMLDTLLNATSLSDLVNRVDILERLSAHDAKMVEDVEAFWVQVTERRAELARQIAEEKTLAAETQAAQKRVEERLAANQKALAGKEAQIAQLVKEEAARQAKLAAEAKERARRAAEAEAARKQAENAAKARGTSSSTTSGGSSTVRVSVPDSASSSDVVSIAMQYLGCPYVWAGASPSGFDCSGFVMYVYKKVGVSLPHSSRMQYGCGTPVARSDLRPGDLVFFYNPIHHVGIYIGNGQMIHAAGSGKDVRINSIDRGNYYGACRIIL